ncbi:MAG: alpha/beta hydrolase, partial [Phycisphaerae bacterium]|nr:alpha/beta hydrolase [Phycisphaerae bacterium]
MADAAGLLILLAVAAASLVALLTIALVRGMRHPHRRTVAYAVARNLPCDPEERGLMYEAWTLRRSGRGGGDVTLAVWEVQGRGGADAAPLTAVFLHGWGQSCLDTLRTIEPWPDLVARMVLYDLRGHGESGGPSRVGIGEEDDLAALLDELGPGPFVLVGRSLGGGIAWRQA